MTVTVLADFLKIYSKHREIISELIPMKELTKLEEGPST
jgi:hypothetical protein